ncbi:hypothetical protein FRB99_008092 [Tulasnella sp. 403]|nr:hypothetical protein FRB99_008092 [Tulasnella sp. 403]
MAIFSSSKTADDGTSKRKTSSKNADNTGSRSMFGRNRTANGNAKADDKAGGSSRSFSLRKADTLGTARSKVKGAEKAEKEAEKHLQIARKSTKEARDHVTRLEHEVDTDMRNATRKRKEAHSLRSDAKGLGRV